MDCLSTILAESKRDKVKGKEVNKVLSDLCAKRILQWYKCSDIKLQSNYSKDRYVQAVWRAYKYCREEWQTNEYMDAALNVLEILKSSDHGTWRYRWAGRLLQMACQMPKPYILQIWQYAWIDTITGNPNESSPKVWDIIQARMERVSYSTEKGSLGLLVDDSLTHIRLYLMHSVLAYLSLFEHNREFAMEILKWFKEACIIAPLVKILLPWTLVSLFSVHEGKLYKAFLGVARLKGKFVENFALELYGFLLDTHFKWNDMEFVGKCETFPSLLDACLCIYKIPATSISSAKICQPKLMLEFHKKLLDSYWDTWWRVLMSRILEFYMALNEALLPQIYSFED